MLDQYKTIIVVGAGGWLGQAVLRGLLDGITGREDLNGISDSVKIIAADLPNALSALKVPDNKVEKIVVDVCDSNTFEKLNDYADNALIIHVVGIIHPKNVKQFYDINHEGSLNLLRHMAKKGVKRAVVMSSNSPIGTNPYPEHVFDEKSDYNPYMGYGKSKMLLEKSLLNETFPMEVVIIRAPWFYGLNQPARQKEFFEMIRNGKGPIVGSGNNRRSMVFTENLAQGIFLAADKPGINKEVFWIADERPYTMNTIIDTIERLMDDEFKLKCKHKRLRLPGIAAEIAYLIDGAMQAVGLYHPKIHVLSEMNKTIACSISKAKKDLGYKPQVALEEGMRQSLRELYR
ncbi:MAG TPA: NAD(P)-dependent oxidoreductase [Cellvibrionaceae bacterium]